MGGSFIDYQVLYTDQIPTTPIRLGQLLVDESEAAPLDMLKYCSSLSPLTYTSVSDGIYASILASNNVWTGTNTFSSTTPLIYWNETDAAANGRKYVAQASAGVFSLGAVRDDGSRFRSALSFTRGASDSDVTAITFGSASAGSNPTFTFLGTGNVVLNADNQELRFGTGGDDLAIYHDGTNNYLDSNTGALRLRDSGGATKIELNTTGLGFNGATPIARPDYTITNPSTSRSLDVGAATLAQLRAVVGTMIQDLINYGLYQ